MNFRSNRIAAVAVGALLVTAAFAGCGGSDDSGTSKEDYIAQADEICAQFKASTESAVADISAALGAQDLQTAADIFDEQAVVLESAVDEVKALELPSEDQESINEFISLSDQQVEATKALATAMRAEDRAEINAVLTESEELDAQSDTVADEYGFIDCGSAGNDA